MLRSLPTALLIVGLLVRVDDPPWQLFVTAAGTDDRAAREALDAIRAQWRDGFAPMFVDIARLLPGGRRIEPAEAPAESREGEPNVARGSFPSSPQLASAAPGRRRVLEFLERQTGQKLGDDLRAWRRWIWSRNEPLHRDYAVFKGELYARIDPAFRRFFPPGVAASIRLDEIDWGGVRVDGIPPLRRPKTMTAASARWLADGNVVFGLEVNGESRAYPKRILAWHELASDRLGGRDITLVYCTLCGTVIPYDSRIGERVFEFGTSGLLYRSNKLMFDTDTHSLWSALDGAPVVGTLTGSGLRLTALPVVTTTWGEWRREHPATSVLDVDTGFERDYAEGAAYREYFANDRLMFEVPTLDRRLPNKAEVLVLRRELLGAGTPPVAISAERLKKDRVFSFDAGSRRFVVITSRHGANRLYETKGEIIRRGSKDELLDANGRAWTQTSEGLVSEDGKRLPRLPVHRAFWFGWYAQHPDTVLYR